MKPSISINIGPGELVDRLTILRLKAANAPDDDSRKAFEAQLSDFDQIWRTLARSEVLDGLEQALAAVNAELWQAENAIRRPADGAETEQAFIATAKRIPVLNDRRAALKVEIDQLLGWQSTEIKAYEP